ncbi:hypothetical protein ACI8AA_11890 [Geodermatophilus sp. SYSU D01180]
MAGRTRRRGAPLGARLAVITCVTPVQNGYWNAVLGYTNTTSTTATVQRGPYNDMSPDRFDGAQPTQFTPGAHPGAFSVPVPASVGTVRWQVLGMTATAGRDSSTRCPASTPLPADGNGMGIVLTLAAADAVGGASVVVSRRRRDRGTPAPAAG